MRHTPGIPAIVSLFPCSSIGFDIIFTLDLPVKLISEPSSYILFDLSVEDGIYS